MGNNCVFSDAPEPVQNKVPKKLLFSEFFRIYFPSCFLFLVMFLHCAFWAVHDVRLGVRKNVNFSDAEKMTFFQTPKNGAFWLQHSLYGARIPYLLANRLQPRISRDQHIQTCQFKTTNVKIHPAVPKV